MREQDTGQQETKHKHFLDQQHIAKLFIYPQLSLQNTQSFLPSSPQPFQPQRIWITMFLQAIIFNNNFSLERELRSHALMQCENTSSN